MTDTKAADHWDQLAQDQIDRADWEASLGYPYGSTRAYHTRAETYRRCAKTLRLHAATGETHCMCHLQPVRLCPFSGLGLGRQGRSWT